MEFAYPAAVDTSGDDPSSAAQRPRACKRVEWAPDDRKRLEHNDVTPAQEVRDTLHDGNLLERDDSKPSWTAVTTATDDLDAEALGTAGDAAAGRRVLAHAR